MTLGIISSHFQEAAAPGGSTYDAGVLADSPLAYYRLDETSGTVMADSSGNGHDGAYNLSPTLGAIGPITSDANNHAMTLNGSTQYAGIAHGTWLNVAAVTLEAWVKTTDTDGIVWGTADTNGSPHFLRVHSTLGLYFECRNTSSTGYYAYDSAPASLRDGNWHHIVGTYEPGAIKVYRDGVLTATNTSGSPVGNLLTVAQSRYIGRRGNGIYLAADVARPALYGSALSAARVAAHFAAAA